MPKGTQRPIDCQGCGGGHQLKPTDMKAVIEAFTRGELHTVYQNGKGVVDIKPICFRKWLDENKVVNRRS